MIPEQTYDDLRDALGDAGQQVEEAQAALRLAEVEAEAQKERADGAVKAHDLVAGALADMGKQLTQVEGERDEARIDLKTIEGQRDDYRKALKRESEDRDRLAEQLASIEARVHRLFADADIEGVSLDRLTVDELTEMVTRAIRSEAPDA